MKYLMIFLVGIYRKVISPIKPKCCRFTPTCSEYAIEAFMKRGFFVGFILSFWRILRCNPFCKGGYDPVPEKGFTNRGKKKGELPEIQTCDGLKETNGDQADSEQNSDTAEKNEKEI